MNRLALLPDIERYFHTMDLESAVQAAFSGKYTCELQPNGTQRSPDFYIRNNETILSVEAKSTKTGNIMWNDGVPVPDTVYIYGNSKTGEVTYFLSEHVLTEQYRLACEQAKVDLKNIVDDYNNSVGMRIITYLRPHFAINSFKPLKDFAPFGGTVSLSRSARELETKDFIHKNLGA